MSEVYRYLRAMVAVAVVLAIGLTLYSVTTRPPEDLPWTALDLDAPPGRFTGRKLAGLTGDAARCRALLGRAGVRYTALSPLGGNGTCGYADGIRLDADAVRFAPKGVGMACPVAAAMVVLERFVVQPAAMRRFGLPVATVEHFGSYNCRRIYGRGVGDWSEHATADAIDLSGFVLSNGTRISVVRDWGGAGAKAAFLRDVRKGACRLFSTVLSPEYNAAHRDHFHLDQAERGEFGRRLCR